MHENTFIVNVGMSSFRDGSTQKNMESYYYIYIYNYILIDKIKNKEIALVGHACLD